MLTSDHPCAAYQRDSARVENLGPSITTIVPPSTTSAPALFHAGQQVPSQTGAVRIGELDMARAGVEVGLHATRRAVHELVGDHEAAGTEVAVQAARGARCHHLPDADGAQRPQVRPVAHPVRGQLVARPMARKEGDPPWTQGALRPADGDGGRGQPVRSGDLVLLHVVEEAVEARAADDTDGGRRRVRHAAQSVSHRW
jgi:hypothetical protein